MTNITQDQLEQMQSRIEKARYIEKPVKRAEPFKPKGRKKHEDLQNEIYKEKNESYIVAVNIVPLSINKAYRGRRFKTKEHTKWKIQVIKNLPPLTIPKPPYEIYLKFGFSSLASDWDNCIKTAQDAIATKYKFNDKLIRRGVVETEIVPKGKEYFEFQIKHLNNENTTDNRKTNQAK